MTSQNKALQKDPSTNVSTHGKISFGTTIDLQTENSTSKRAGGTDEATAHRDLHRFEQQDAVHRYFLEIDGHRSVLAPETINLLTTECIAEEIRPFEIVDFHFAVRQLCVSAAEPAGNEVRAGLDEDCFLLPWRLG